MTLSHPDQPFTSERRAKQRVNCSYPTTVRGKLDTGQLYETRAVLTNLSANGMYLCLKRVVAPGEQLQVVVRMATGPLGAAHEPRLSASGEVTRIESKPDGTCGVALKLHRRRFI